MKTIMNIILKSSIWKEFEIVYISWLEIVILIKWNVFIRNNEDVLFCKEIIISTPTKSYVQWNNRLSNNLNWNLDNLTVQ